MDKNFPSDEDVETFKGKIKSKRNLKQYKNLSDNEFDNVMAQKALGLESSKELETRISAKLAEYESDYDLSDLKINDRETLRALIQAVLALEDYEQKMFKLRSEGINDNTLYMSEKLSKLMSDLRSDISKLQADLNITRKVRKSDQDVSVLAYIEGLKQKAKKFYESKMGYIFCECGMLLGTIWTQYPEDERNKVVLICGRVLENGETCGKKTIVSTSDLLKKRGTNKLEITPESML